MWTRERVQAAMRERVLEPVDGVDEAFLRRFDAGFAALWERLLALYGTRYDFLYQLEDILRVLAEARVARPAALRALDDEREKAPHWYLSPAQVGVTLYVDLFAGTLRGLEQRLDYLAGLGVTLVHLMPLFRSPPGDDDGGYAVSDFREVDPALGTMDDLAELAERMRARGMSLALDFILNHTADDHDWARRARQGERACRDFYYIFETRAEADEYDRYLREIFPSVRRGSFTYVEEAGGWVWTTFNSFQWDLNYRNPAVFREMAAQMLFLANRGAEVLRFDALAFCWKEKGTVCESLPGAHTLIQAFKAAVNLVAPALSFLSEAIVHPDEVVEYIAEQECELSYNPLIMATSWEALATRETALLRQALARRYALPSGCAWINYLRCHDDIGWTFSDEDAAELGIRGYDHRLFLNRFYNGRFAGSFARGVPFQENPQTGDARVCGTLASLAGLEKALAEEGAAEVDIALRRMRMLWAFVMALPGIPLLYAGDEIAMLNDHAYLDDPATAGDSRWVHRQPMDWDREPGEPGRRMRETFRRLARLRQSIPALAGELTVLPTAPPNLLAFACRAGDDELVFVASFGERPAVIDDFPREFGLAGTAYRDLLTDERVEARLRFDAYRVYWLRPEPGA